MPPLNTREQARQYLAEIFPTDREWRIHQFPHGWISQPILTAEQIAAGQGVGMTNLVIDSGTAVVTQYPSWSTEMVSQDYIRRKQLGQPPSGRQVYPPQYRTSIQRTHEDPGTIRYRVRTESLTRPQDPATEFEMTVDKNTLRYQPPGSTAARAVSWAEWKYRQDGRWPEQGTWED